MYIKVLFWTKKTSLCKPFIILMTNGYIVDTTGPVNGNLYLNDALTIKMLL